jgi:hypothetical protein
MFKSYLEMGYIAGFSWLGSCPISNERLSIGIYNSIVYTLPFVCVFYHRWAAEVKLWRVDLAGLTILATSAGTDYNPYL